jgi:hypothetical protein
VTSEQVGEHLDEPLAMIHKLEVMANLGVSEIMPVAKHIDAKIFEQPSKFWLRRKCFDTNAVFDSELDSGLFSVFCNLDQLLYDAVVIVEFSPFADRFFFPV